MGRLALIPLTIIALSALWFVGDAHYDRCMDNGRTSCSMLPWDQGRELTTHEQVRQELDGWHVSP